MIRTSRKWKNAVRYQASRVLAGELKLQEIRNTATNPTQTAPYLSVYNLTAAIVQGLQSNQRVGASINVKRVDVWVYLRTADCPGIENRVRCELRQYVNPDDVPPVPITTQTHVETSIASIDWTSGAPRVRGGETFTYNGNDYYASGTREFVKILRGRTVNLMRVPARLNQLSYTSGAAYPSQNSLQSNVYSGDAEQIGRSATVANVSNPAGTISTPFHIDSVISTRMGGGGRMFQRVRLFKSWPGKGLRVNYTEGGVGDSLKQADENHVFLVIGQSKLSIHPATTAEGYASSFQYYARVWYTDD